MSVARTCARVRRKLKNDPRYKRVTQRSADRHKNDPVERKQKGKK